MSFKYELWESLIRLDTELCWRLKAFQWCWSFVQTALLWRRSFLRISRFILGVIHGKLNLGLEDFWEINWEIPVVTACLKEFQFYMKIHIFALRWKDEIRRSSQLRTLLKLVVYISKSSFTRMFICTQFIDQLPVGLLAQLVEHCTGTAEVMGSNPVRAWNFFQVLLTTTSISSDLSCEDLLISEFQFCSTELPHGLEAKNSDDDLDIKSFKPSKLAFL